MGEEIQPERRSEIVEPSTTEPVNENNSNSSRLNHLPKDVIIETGVNGDEEKQEEPKGGAKDYIVSSVKPPRWY